MTRSTSPTTHVFFLFWSLATTLSQPFTPLTHLPRTRRPSNMPLYVFNPVLPLILFLNNAFPFQPPSTVSSSSKTIRTLSTTSLAISLMESFRPPTILRFTSGLSICPARQGRFPTYLRWNTYHRPFRSLSRDIDEQGRQSTRKGECGGQCARPQNRIADIRRHTAYTQLHTRSRSVGLSLERNRRTLPHHERCKSKKCKPIGKIASTLVNLSRCIIRNSSPAWKTSNPCVMDTFGGSNQPSTVSK